MRVPLGIRPKTADHVGFVQRRTPLNVLVLIAFVGFILLAVASIRADVLPRGAGWLMIVGIVVGFGVLRNSFEKWTSCEIRIYFV